VHLEDHELLKKARAAGTGGEFSRLYDGGEILTGDGTHSDGDIALCGMLAYWTGCNPEQMDRLFRGSALMRPKWNTYRTENAERGRTAGTYGSQTIEKAVANCQQVYRGATEAGGQEDRARRLKEALAELETYSHALPWAGGNGPRKRFVYGALINTGGGYGELVSGGAEIKVCASHRQLALAAGIGSRDSVKKTLTELEGDDLIRIETPAKFTKKDTDQGIPKAEATTFFLLLDPPRTAGPPTYYPPRVNYYGPALRALLGRVRDDSPLIVPEVKRRSKNRKRTVTYVSYIDRVAPVEGSIGKLAALVLERICVAGSGGEAEADGVLLNELGCSLGRRGRDLRSRQIKVLLEHGFIVETEPGSDRYRPADDLCELLEAHLEETGTVRAEQRQKHRYEQEQGDFRLNRDLRGELRQQRKRDREATNLRGREYMTEIFDARAREDAARDEEAALQALTEQINHNAHKRKEIDEATQFVHEELTDLPTTAMPLGNMLERWKERGGKLGELMRGIEKAGAIVFREPLDRNHEHVSFPGVRDEEERKLRGIEQRRRAQKAEQRRTA